MLLDAIAESDTSKYCVYLAHHELESIIIITMYDIVSTGDRSHES